MIYLKLFLSFLQVGLFSIGGGYAALPLIQSQVVEENGWLSMSEFTDLITIAEMTPGPITINSATFVGIRIAGVTGAVSATIGCILPAFIFASLLAFVYYRYRKLSVIKSILESLRPAVVALIASAGLTILRAAVFGEAEISFDNIRWIEAGCFAAAFLILRKCRWNPILAMILCGAAGLGLHLLFP
ncbi:MAG: chromate transporter [Eubacteriales bacterium]|nr:chromate transporter [Eubacteriales bacterium]